MAVTSYDTVELLYFVYIVSGGCEAEQQQQSKICQVPGNGKCLLLFLLPSDNVQHDLQHGLLITFPKEENLGNKREVFIIARPRSGLAC